MLCALRLVRLDWSNNGSVLALEYLRPSGQIVAGKCSDRSNLIFEDMTLPLFYNPSKIKDSFVFLENGDCEIVQPGFLDRAAVLSHPYR